MSNTESQEKGSSSEDKDLFNPKNVTEHAETRYERFIEHIEQPGWNNTCNWGWWRISKIPIPWDSEEKKENTTTVKKIRFEVIPGEAQNNWEVTDGITKFAKKYFEKYVSDKELKNSMTLNSPVPRNVPKAKIMDEYFVKLLEHQKKKKGIALDNTFKKIQSKILTIIGPLSKVWYTVEESLAGVSKKFDGDKMLQYIDQTVLLIRQAFDSVFYSRRMNVLTGVKTEKVKVMSTLKPGLSSQRRFQRTFWQVSSEAHGSYS